MVIKNCYNKNMKYLDIKLDAKSHQPTMKMMVKNMPKGMVINHGLIKDNLEKRRPNHKFNTNRVELDQYEFISGVTNNITNGEELIISVTNTNINSNHYEYGIIRPGHADYVGYEFLEDYDYNGGGQFSGRITVLYTILASIIQPYLPEEVLVKLSQIGNVIDTPIYEINDEELKTIDNELYFYDQQSLNEARSLINQYYHQGDSIGALAEVRIANPTGGLGGIDFNNFEGNLAQALFAIGGIKGINFGIANNFITTPGSVSCDELFVNHGKVNSKHHYQGGVNGGITNGYEPITFNCIIKAPCSVFKPINTIKKTNHGYENTTLILKGRHDSLIANRVLMVIKAMTYIILFDEHLAKSQR